MGRYTAPHGELPWRRGHEEAMRAKVPGKMSLLTSRCPTKSCSGFGGKSEVRVQECTGGEKGRTHCNQNEHVQFKWLGFWRGAPEPFSTTSALQMDMVRTLRGHSYCRVSSLRWDMLHNSERQPGGLSCSELFGSTATGNRCTPAKLSSLGKHLKQTEKS